MKDLLSAVYYLHNMKPTIIHRDIKPENILLDENSKAYLTDFGWSNYKRNDRRRNTVCGTPLYLPPEMVGEFGHDETADIWCIGVLLFELINGTTPFGGIDFETVKYNISRLNIAWPRVMDPDAKDLCSKILKLNGKDRLPIEQILKHKFFTKFFPNAVNELIKPQGQNYKIFVVSKDDPKTWNQVNKQNSSSNIPLPSYNKNNNPNTTTNLKSNIKNQNNLNKSISSNMKYKKINNNTKKKETGGTKTKGIYIPRANIDISKSTINERDNHNNNVSVNSSFSDKRSSNIKNTSYNKYNSSNINKSFTGSNYNDNRPKNITLKAFNSYNKYRNSYKGNSINNSFYNSNSSGNDKYRNSYKYNNNSIKISTNTNKNNYTNYNKNFKHSNTYNYINTDCKNISRGGNQNTNFYSSYNYKK